MAISGAFKAQAAIESSCGSTARRLAGQAAIVKPSATSARRSLWRTTIESRSGATAGSLRAQAAMEYLVTYGWALLALFIVIAYLVSTGAFSASSFSAQERFFQPDLPCSPYILFKPDGTTTSLRFTLANGLGFPIKVASVNYTVIGIGEPGKRTLSGAVPPSVVPPGARMNFSYDFSGATQPAARDFRTISVLLEYENCRSSPCSGPYVTSGRIAAVVEGK